MASTYSALKIELLETGANSGTWGTATNVNLGDAILGEAITGSATVDFASNADVTITLTDVSTTQAARNLRLNITESGGGVGSVRNLILGSGCQIEKFYLIRNNGTGVKTVKNTSGTGVAVAAGKATLVYNDGTNVVDVLNSFSSAILGAENAGSIIPFYFANQAAFPSASTYHGAIAHSHADGAMYFAHSGNWVRMLDADTDVTVAQGGTGLSTLTANNVIIGNGTSAPLFVAPSTNGNVLTSNGTTWVSSAGASVSAATPTALGTVFGQTNTVNPKQTFLGYQAGNSTTGNQNTFVGWQAGFANTSGTENIAIGESSFKANTTGSNNTVVGTEALRTNTSGSGNVALGQSAMGLNTTGISNVAVGVNAINANTTGDYNVAVGRLALAANDTASNNTAVGYSALDANTTGASNVAVGTDALGANTTASSNTAVGYKALKSNTTGTLNVALGTDALVFSTTGSSNVAIGRQALFSSSTADFNVAVGANSLLQNSTGTNNLAVGYQALDEVTTGTQNVGLGTGAGSSGTNDLTTGSNNTIIGYNAAASSASVSNEVTLGNSSITKLRIPGLSVDWDADAIPFRNIPQNSQSAAYTLVASDSGKHIFHPVADNNARTFTIPANSSVAYPIGTALTFINMAVANVTIAITTDTLTLSPAGTTGSRTLATNGSATCIKITSTSWLISGSGLT